jgi:hypothetical protein
MFLFLFINLAACFRLMESLYPIPKKFEGPEFIQVDAPFVKYTDDINELIRKDKHGYRIVQLDNDTNTLLQILDDNDNNSTSG